MSAKNRILTLTTGAAILTGSLFGAAAPAQAATVADWDRIAACESGGNWSIDTGNGFYGGLQFSQRSWEGVGGTGNPAHASKAEQITRAEILQDLQGWGAWPLCGKKAGLSGADNVAPAFTLADITAAKAPAAKPLPVERTVVTTPTAPKAATPTPKPAAPKAAPAKTTPATSGTTITVAPGDTLWILANKHQVAGGWQALHQANLATVKDPSVLNVGQKLTLPGAATAAKPAVKAPATGKTITVSAGDTLHKLAVKHNIAGGWKALHQANLSTVTDPNVLYVGQELILPR